MPDVFLRYDRVRLQVLLWHGPSRRWYTVGEYNPERIRNVYFDALPSGGHTDLRLGDLFCRTRSPSHVAIYIGGAAPGYLGYRVVESASDGQVEGVVMRDLKNVSTYHAYRLRTEQRR